MHDDDGLRASIHFPIEGQSPWVFLLRMIAGGSVITFVMVALMIAAFMPEWRGHLPLALAGLAAFLLFEFTIFRVAIVPRLNNYGRFRIYQHMVDYFPLDFSGLRVMPRAHSEPVKNFKGLTVRAQPQQGTYLVMLLHKKTGRSICVKTYNAPHPAHAHADALAHEMNLPYDAPKSIVRRAMAA